MSTETTLEISAGIQSSLNDLAAIAHQEFNSSGDSFPMRISVESALQRTNHALHELGVSEVPAAKVLSYLELQGAIRRDKREYVVNAWDY